MSTWGSYKLPNGKLVKGGIGFGLGTAHYQKTGPNGIDRELVEIVKSAVKAGYRHFDAAEEYLNEKSLGLALQESGVQREELFITSKISFPESAKDINATLKKQLADLQTTYVDLYLLHNVTLGDISSVWKQMESVKAAGLTRSIGVSNYRIKHLKELLASCIERPVCNQIELQPYIIEQEQEIIDYCHASDIAVAAYKSSGPLFRFPDGPANANVERIAREMSTSTGTPVTAHQVLLKWAHAKGALVLTTTSKTSRMQEQLAAGALPDLSKEQVQAIDKAGMEGGIRRHNPLRDGL